MHHLAVLLLIAFVAASLAAAVVKKSNEGFKKVMLSALSVLLTLLLLEAVFYFIPKTSNYGKTLCMQVWERYWWQNNRLGFRDKDWAQKDSTKKKLVFIGDSFTAGQGIKNPAHRYADLTGRALQDSFEFYNAGISGTNTETKAQILYGLPFKPDVLVYEYFTDDIVDTRIRLDGIRPHKNPYKNTPKLLIPLIEHSYLLNYVYWMFPHFIMSDYQTYLTDSYHSPTVAAEHHRIIGQLINYCQTNHIRLVVLTLPLPSEYDFSNQLSRPIEQQFTDSGILNINPTAALQAQPLQQIIVNRVDTHLNEKGNRLLANIILEKAFGIKPEAKP